MDELDKMVPSSFLLPRSLKTQLRLEAARRDMTMSDLLREVLSQKLGTPTFFADGAHRGTQNAHGSKARVARKAR